MVINCLQHDPKMDDRVCNAREFQSSHGGGNDYSAPCVLNVNEKGRHKGQHRTAHNKYSWNPGPSDRWEDGTWSMSKVWVDKRFIKGDVVLD